MLMSTISPGGQSSSCQGFIPRRIHLLEELFLVRPTITSESEHVGSKPLLFCCKGSFSMFYFINHAHFFYVNYKKVCMKGISLFLPRIHSKHYTSPKRIVSLLMPQIPSESEIQGINDFHFTVSDLLSISYYSFFNSFHYMYINL